MRLSWILQNFLARPHRYSTSHFLFSPFSIIQCICKIFSITPLAKEDAYHIFLSPPFAVSLFILNLYWMKWSLITFSIFFSLRTKSIKPKTKHTNTHTHELNKIPKKIAKYTKTNLSKNIYKICMYENPDIGRGTSKFIVSFWKTLFLSLSLSLFRSSPFSSRLILIYFSL